MKNYITILLIMGLLIPTLSIASTANTLYSVCRNDNLLRLVDPLTGATISSTPILIDGQATPDGVALARRPNDGLFFAVMDFGSDRQLITIDVDQMIFTLVGGPLDRMTAIAFDGNEDLIGVTGSGGDFPETLFRIDQTDASTEQLMSLGRGWDGESLAYNADDSHLYHTSGYGNSATFERMQTYVNESTVDIPVSGALVRNSCQGMVFWEDQGIFLWAASSGAAPYELWRVSVAGYGSYVGAMDHISHGLALHADAAANTGPILYSVEENNPELNTVDPATAATTGTVAITCGVEVVRGGYGLAVHPVTNTMYALLRYNDGSPFGSFYLCTLDPATGVATEIGYTGEYVKGLAFDDAGNLYTMTGEMAAQPECMYLIDTTSAALDYVMYLGRGDFGEVLGWNPYDGLFYHSSGCGVQAIFEKIVMFEDCTELIPIDSPIADEVCMASTYWRNEAVFLWALGSSAPQDLYRVASDGSSTYAGELDHKAVGLAFVEKIIVATQPSTFSKFKKMY